MKKIEEIIEKIGNSGRYQKRFILIFIIILPIFAAMPYLNLVLSLAVPDHWCHVPGRIFTNFTAAEWKNLTIPLEFDSKNNLRHSQCKRYTNSAINKFENSKKIDEIGIFEEIELEIIQCDNGWDFDTTWYEKTAPIQYNWVCDQELLPATTLSTNFASEVLGIFTFGIISDIYGRRPMFFVAVTTVLFGRIMSTLTSNWEQSFQFFSFIGSLFCTSMIQGPLVIITEISSPENRALISMILFCAMNIGVSLNPLIFWLLRDWIPFVFVTSIPCGIYLFSKPWIIESPRWLASKGKIKQCIQELEKIAKVNQRKLPKSTENNLIKFYESCKNEKGRYWSILAIFSSFRLAKNGLLIAISWSMVLQIYMSLTINVANLDGNPFVNYLLHSLAELPAFLIGRVICDRVGRRVTSFLSFGLTFLSALGVTFLINDASNVFVITSLCIFMKFSITLAYYTITMQALEIYPTCIRQTGLAVGVIVANALGTITPYIVALGVTVDASLPFVMYAISSVVGIFCMCFLPETKGCLLPETLKDAAEFGRHQNFWGKETNVENGSDNLI